MHDIFLPDIVSSFSRNVFKKVEFKSNQKTIKTLGVRLIFLFRRKKTPLALFYSVKAFRIVFPRFVYDCCSRENRKPSPQRESFTHTCFRHVPWRAASGSKSSSTNNSGWFGCIKPFTDFPWKTSVNWPEHSCANLSFRHTYTSLCRTRFARPRCAHKNCKL